MKVPMKWLIVNGDDFGITAGINRGIIEAHRKGILTSTSLLVDRPACEEAVALGHENPTLSVGLHLELDPNRPQSVMPEVERQYAQFVEMVDTAPTHVDSHHDVHYDARVLPQLREWAASMGVPLRGQSLARHFKKFYGQWAGETHLEQIDAEGFLRLVDAEVGEGVTELTCHPGYVEPGFPSSYAAEREVELRTLCDPRVREALVKRGIQLVGFQDLPALVRIAATESAR
jgi:chitin disaccharide deacetylase